MRNILAFIDKKAISVKPCSIKNGDIFFAPKHHLMGLVLSNDIIVVLNAKYMYSFRIQHTNLNLLPKCFIYRFSNDITFDHAFLENYLKENNDNPYALQNIFNILAKPITNDLIYNLTQFPPLTIPKDSTIHKNNCNHLYSSATFADVLFTYDRTNKISQFIRKIDRCQWSHMGFITENKTVIEMTTDGIRDTDLNELFSSDVDLALYRIKDLVLKQEQIASMKDNIQNLFIQNPTYNWIGVIKKLIIKKFNLNIKYSLCMSDFIYSNKLKLITYA